MFELGTAQLKSSADQLMDQRPLVVAAGAGMGHDVTSVWTDARSDERRG